MTVEIASDSKPTSVMVRTRPSVSARRSGRHRLSVWSLVAGRSIRQGWRKTAPAARGERPRAGGSAGPPLPQRRPEPRDGRGMTPRMRAQGPVQPEQRRAHHGECLGTTNRGVRRGRPDPVHDAGVERRVARLRTRLRPGRPSGRDASGGAARMIARAIAISSSACRSRIERATASPDPAAAKTTGDSSASRPCARVPASILRVTSIGRATPNRAGTSVSRVVRGPRPSRARTAAPSAAVPMSCPPPQSPEMSPSAASRAVRPSGAIPAALTPWPQMSATPQPRRLPARIGGEGVVDHDAIGRQAARRRAPRSAAACRRACPRRPARRRRPARLAHRASRPAAAAQVGDQPRHPLDPRLEADLLVRRRRPAQRGQQPAVGRDEREVGLRIPAVDGKDHLSTPVTTRPRVKKRWVSRKATTGMTSVISVPAWIRPGSRIVDAVEARQAQRQRLEVGRRPTGR